MAGSPLNAPRRPWGCFGCLGVLVVLALAGAGLAALEHLRGPSEVSNPSVEFSAKPQPVTTPKAPVDAQDTYDDGADWPVYGGNPARTRYLPFAGRAQIRPPFTERWGNTGRAGPPGPAGSAAWPRRPRRAARAASTRRCSSATGRSRAARWWPCAAATATASGACC